MEILNEEISNLRYAINQEIVYPLHGVGRITEIKKRNFKDTVLTYYVIYIEVSDMTVMVPINRADELGIRPIVSAEASKEALEIIGKPYEPVPSDWKIRYQMNLDLLKSGTVNDIANVVKTLYHRSKVKELPILERKLFDNAIRLLIDEISSSLEKDKQEIEKLIYSTMEESSSEMDILQEPSLEEELHAHLNPEIEEEEDLDLEL